MRLALVFVLTTLVATCGQKGPLELPESLVPANVPANLSAPTCCPPQQTSGVR